MKLGVLCFCSMVALGASCAEPLLLKVNVPDEIPVARAARQADGAVLSFDFEVKAYCAYELDLDAKSKDGKGCRFHYQVDESPWFPIDAPAGDAWTPLQVNSSPLKPGLHAIRVRATDPVVCRALAYRPTAADVDELPPEKRDWHVLPPVRSKPRVTVREVGFVPDEIGAAEVCLWKGDAIGAATFTIDDNNACDIDWWLETSAKYGTKLTWFLIPNLVGRRNPYHGMWEDYRRVYAAGHDVQSHSFTHFSDEKLTALEEYLWAKEAIERNIPGNRVLTLGYPGSPLSMKNTWAAAMTHHIGARCGFGLPNEAGKINYRCTNSFHGDFTLDAASFVGLSNLVVRSSKFKNSYRAWNCHHLHGMPASKPDYRAKVERAMAFYKAHGVWMPHFLDVMKYGQERDTAKVETVRRTDRCIVLSLTDRMNDAIYDFPLSLRLRVPDGWKRVSVAQGASRTTVDVKNSGGVSSVLFDAIPDRGEIIVNRL